MLNSAQQNIKKKAHASITYVLLNRLDECIERFLTYLSLPFGCQPNQIFSVIVGLVVGLIVGSLLL
jgi:hypothetical protein